MYLVEDSEKEKKNQYDTNLLLDPGRVKEAMYSLVDAQTFWSSKIKQDIIEWTDFMSILKEDLKVAISPQDESQLVGILGSI